MTIFLRLALVLGLLVLAALVFGPARIDGTSSITAAASIEEIASGLPPEQRERFQESVRFVVADTLGRSSGFWSGTTGSSAAEEVAIRLDGMTASQVIAHVEEIRGRREGAEE